MDENKKIFYKNQAETIIKKLKIRKMEGFYAPTSEDACAKVMELIGEAPKSVAYGGSVTVDGLGLKKKVVDAGHELIVRENYKSEEEVRELKAKTINADTFLMSTNAITLDGELVNIDGRGNRLAYLAYGPEQVIVIAGMNKVVTNVAEGFSRSRNIASAANTVRLQRRTPCSETGKCGNCFEQTICCSELVSRASMIPGRIKVVLVGEELGY